MTGEYADKTLARCPNCSKIYTAGGVTCTHCGMPIASRMRKNKTETGESPVPSIRDGKSEKPIIFYCGSKRLSITLKDSLVIGRNSNVPGDPEPDIDLSDFDAFHKGVSRQHIKVVYNNEAVFVADLGSSNSTLLNGIPLIPHRLKQLRNGDELRLGSLQLRVAI